MLLQMALFCSFIWLTLFYCKLCRNNQDFPGGPAVKNPPANAGKVGEIPGSGRSPGGGNGNPLHYSCLKNPMDKRSLLGYRPWGCRVRHDLVTKQQQKYSIVNMYHMFFIHSSGHLGCLHALAIVNSAAVNTGVRVSFLLIFFSGCMPRSGTAGLYGSSVLV